MSFYEDISVEFQKVSQFFKYGNLRLFQKDMAHYLTDLQFTKGKDTYVYTLKCLPAFIKYIQLAVNIYKVYACRCRSKCSYPCSLPTNGLFPLTDPDPNSDSDYRTVQKFSSVHIPKLFDFSCISAKYMIQNQ